MQQTPYGLRVELPLSFEEAIDRATTALKAEGFGVLTSIDVKETLEQKLNADFRKYTILGACNPPLAHRALQAELEVGLLLPCNVVVYETGPRTSVVAAMDPMMMVSVVGENAELSAVAKDADARLRRMLASLGG